MSDIDKSIRNLKIALAFLIPALAVNIFVSVYQIIVIHRVQHSKPSVIWVKPSKTIDLAPAPPPETRNGWLVK